MPICLLSKLISFHFLKIMLHVSLVSMRLKTTKLFPCVKHISPGTTLNTLFQTYFAIHDWSMCSFFSSLLLLFLVLFIQSDQCDHATGYNLNTISSENVLESSIIELRKAIKWFHLQLWSTTHCFAFLCMYVFCALLVVVFVAVVFSSSRTSII